MLENGHFTARNTAPVQMPRLCLWQRHGSAGPGWRAALSPSLPAWAMGRRGSHRAALWGDCGTRPAPGIPASPIPAASVPPQASPSAATSAQTPAAPRSSRYVRVLAVPAASVPLLPHATRPAQHIHPPAAVKRGIQQFH